LYLKADDKNYYKISNTDGYGPGKIEKVVNGKIVDSSSFNTEYTQKNIYPYFIKFSEAGLEVNAFGDVLHLNKNKQSIAIKQLEINLAQQDGYFDDIIYSGQ